ncbi:MAG: spermidine/putrescine transport system substrate-binding protein [Thermoleophilaceae bacterium]|jgi:spermidine/putrescine transport system substrate-binding protein|nr:spermidine/putrescine transport system substrate-binding protein [Thermoleophilaceae bacterium]MEA2407892.1 spermidine/putrescine transport system substrate-binding protein [Thermoleophilaceae bacterium]
MTRWMPVATLAVLASLAAAGCGTDEPTATSGDEKAPVVKKGEVGGKLTISQWPLYIDPGKRGTIAEFEKASGVDVKYVEEINDNNEFFGKLRPLLERGDTGGRSMITLSDWLAARMYKLGYLQRFDYSQLPNVKKNMLPALRHPAADPKREFTIPWQSGMTGLIVRSDLAPGVDEIADLFDPKYKGKVSMLTEMRDTVPMTLKSMGIDPDKASKDDWLSAVDKVAEAAGSGQIRKFTGNEYIKDLPKGDTWIALGWSGDAVQLQKDSPSIKFVMPKEGCMLWSTSMEIPAGAPNAQAAQAFINFVYDPEVQADIAEWVNYVTPVQGVKEILRKRDPALANSQLIFPSEQYTANCSFEPVLGGQLGQEVTEAFQRAIGS